MKKTSNEIVLLAIQQIAGCKDKEDAIRFARCNQTAYNVALAALAIANGDLVEQVAIAAKRYIETIKTE